MHIKLFNTIRDSSFPKYNLDAWVESKLYDSLSKEIGNTDEIFVEIKSNDPLNAFSFYLKLQRINEKNAVSSDYIYLSDDLKGSEWTLENNVSVSVKPISLKDLPIIEVLTIKLKPEEVSNWSNEEENFAINAFLTQNSIVYKDQKVWIKPATKKTVLGEIVDLKTISKINSGVSCYQLSAVTKVVLEGLSEDKQKVIDFTKIGGLENVITKLREIIQVPLQYPELLGKFDIKPPKGLILHGPPGNGKTMIARAVSHSLGAKFIFIEGPELLSRYVGVAEQQLRSKFEEAENHGNCVLFIDEIDAIAANRDTTNAEHQISIVATLLTLMDGIRANQKIFVLAATNRIHAIDPALRRPGRFDLEFEIPLPDKNARFDILTKYINLQNTAILTSDIDSGFLLRLSELTNGYSGADLYSLYREASMNSIRSNTRFDEVSGKLNVLNKLEEIKLKKHDFEKALRSITPTSMRGIDNRANYTQWNEILGLDYAKTELEKILSLRNRDDINFQQRHRFYNVLIKGIKGVGKSTLIGGLGKEFGYEILSLDFIHLQSLSLSDALKEIEATFIKAKQIAPSIIQLYNLVNLNAHEALVIKVFEEIHQLNGVHKVLFIAELDSTDTPDCFIVKGEFGKIIELSNVTDDTTLRTIYESNLPSNISVEKFIEANQNKATGRVLSDLSEFKVLNQNYASKN